MEWNRKDVLRVEEFNKKDGFNHLPSTPNYESSCTWFFYERLIHILEGDMEFDFKDFSEEDFRNVNWLEIKIVLQKLRGEEPEEYEENLQIDEQINLFNMQEVRHFLIRRFQNDFSIPNLDNTNSLEM